MSHCLWVRLEVAWLDASGLGTLVSLPSRCQPGVVSTEALMRVGGHASKKAHSHSWPLVLAGMPPFSFTWPLILQYLSSPCGFSWRQSEPLYMEAGLWEGKASLRKPKS